MAQKILNQKQIRLLQFISQNKFLQANFYWTGGTALATLYLGHRLSKDLDFFSEKLLADELILYHINKLKQVFDIKKIRYLKDKNRQIFSLYFHDRDIIKLEFVYFPFGKIKNKITNKQFGIKVDSLRSIAEK